LRPEGLLKKSGQKVKLAITGKDERFAKKWVIFKIERRIR
jgi:ribosomal protein L39E